MRRACFQIVFFALLSYAQDSSPSLASLQAQLEAVKALLPPTCPASSFLQRNATGWVCVTPIRGLDNTGGWCRASLDGSLSVSCNESVSPHGQSPPDCKPPGGKWLGYNATRGAWICACNVGWSGTSCEVSDLTTPSFMLVPSCYPSGWSSLYRLVVGRLVCECLSDWTGSNCEEYCGASCQLSGPLPPPPPSPPPRPLPPSPEPSILLMPPPSPPPPNPISTPIFNATTISQAQVGNLTLTAGNFIINGQLGILSGRTLTIDRGVNLYFLPGASIVLRGCSLLVSGTFESPVTFLPYPGSDGSTTNALVFMGGFNYSAITFQNVVFMNLGSALSERSSAGDNFGSFVATNLTLMNTTISFTFAITISVLGFRLQSSTFSVRYTWNITCMDAVNSTIVFSTYASRSNTPSDLYSLATDRYDIMLPAELHNSTLVETELIFDAGIYSCCWHFAYVPIVEVYDSRLSSFIATAIPRVGLERITDAFGNAFYDAWSAGSVFFFGCLFLDVPVLTVSSTSLSSSLFYFNANSSGFRLYGTQTETIVVNCTFIGTGSGIGFIVDGRLTMNSSIISGIDTLFLLNANTRNVLVNNNTFSTPSLDSTPPFIVINNSPYDADFTGNFWGDRVISSSLIFDAFDDVSLGEVKL